MVAQAATRMEPPKGLDLIGALRAGKPPGQSPSPGAAPKPPGTHTPGQSNPGTTVRVFAPTYSTWVLASENPSAEQAPPPAAPDDSATAQPTNPARETDWFGQEQRWQEASATIPPEPSQPEPPPPVTVLVYKDGHQVEVQDYAIMGQYLVWFSHQLSKKIPLADLDLPATRKVNEDHGVTFNVPNAP
jgi:hypothetical protein